MITKITKLSAGLALFIAAGYFGPLDVRAELGATASPSSASLGNGPVMVPLANSLATAAATVINGHVMKMLSNGQNKFFPQSPCRVGDVLSDGSVIQTGRETSSMAELKWGSGKGTGKVSRVWRDSTVRIFAGRSSKIDTLCIPKGGLIFMKDKKDPDYYYVETKLLQARIHGTTVRVQSAPPVGGNDGIDKIMVLEEGTLPNGTPALVRVKNKETGSIVDLPVGVELVVKVRASYKCNDARFDIPMQSQDQGQLPPRSSATQENHIAKLDEVEYRLNPKKAEFLFDDKTSSVSAYTANARAILEDPMIKGSADIPPIESLDLIETAMKDVPSSDKLWKSTMDEIFNFGRPDKLISSLKIIHVPDTMYTVGHNVGQQGEFRPITLPSTDHLPAARLDYDVNKLASANLKPQVRMMSVLSIPMTGSAAEDPNAANLEALEAPDQMALKHEDHVVVDSEAN